VVAVIQQRTWTNGKTRNHLSSLQHIPMQLCALETHIRISRNLKTFVDLLRNHRSGPEPSPYPLQAQQAAQKISGNLIVGCNGSARLLQGMVIGLQDYWRQISANSSIVACGTANPTSFLHPVVGSASLLSATAIFWRLAIIGGVIPSFLSACSCVFEAHRTFWDQIGLHFSHSNCTYIVVTQGFLAHR